LEDRAFTDLPDLLGTKDLLVFNDTKVLKARLLGRKDSGGRIEAMIERIVAEREVLALIKASHAPKTGSSLIFDPGPRPGPGSATDPAPGVAACKEAGMAGAAMATVFGRDGDLYRLSFQEPVAPLLERIGRLPLPPYISHAAEADDEARYQTVYASHPGAVAAPTAGLHFDPALLDRLRSRGVSTAMLTLHVGSGTFLPVRTEDLALHRMHSERFDIPPATAQMVAQTRARGGQVIAVGTTSLRALEASGGGAGPAETDIFITPGYPFKVVDGLVTNFHLPRSTLLMLVSAFGGVDTIRRAYAHAITGRYRFFSYGDAMLLNRRKSC
nr:tRNA preQ1(34) S-adenosylmethionine ribosyltransferase-isomerase QueA [Lautropia sp.]